jgi:hypothetical protein
VHTIAPVRSRLWSLLFVLGTVAPGACSEPGGAAVLAGDPPVIFNAPQSARPGDLVGLQGERFGPSPEVWLDRPGSSALRLPLENSVGTGWLAVRIPADVQGGIVVRVRNGDLTSAPVRLNQARPLHLDALQLVPGGAFRVFGRNLLLPGSSPTVTVNGRPASVLPGESDESMLVAIAPAGLDPGPRAVVSVDNGNGSGSAELDRSAEIAAGPASDPFSLRVGWTSAFGPIAARVIRVPAPAVGGQDDSPAFEDAVRRAAEAGGGIVEIPEGTFRIARTVALKSGVVLQGAGKDRTVLRYEKSNYPVWASGFDLIGVRNLTLQNAGGDVEGPLIKGNRRVCLQNVRFDLGVSQQLYLSENRNIVVAGCEFIQKGTVRNQGPYIFSRSAGLVFTGNTTDWKYGAPSFQESHDAYIASNLWRRDASVQNTPVVTTHCCVIDFCHRISVVSNTFDVVNGPVTNRERNDGETLLTEGGGGKRTENLGSVSSATSTTLTDPANTIDVHPFEPGSIPENYGVAIVDGTGAGQTRRVTSYSSKTLGVDPPWEVVPDSSSRYATFVWGLEKSLLKGNTLKGNPRGIWLYQTAVREVDVIGNRLLEGGGIYLRTWQSLADRQFTPHYTVRIAGNEVASTTGVWAAHIGSVYVTKDARPFGIGQIGIEVRDNRLTANTPNLRLNLEDYASIEGYYLLMKPEVGHYEAPRLPPFLGAIFERNSCTNGEAAFRIGTGAAGTMVIGNRLTACKVPLADEPAAPGAGVSEKTIYR